MTLVLDASAALAWIFERSDPREAATAAALLGEMRGSRAIVVPHLWHAEVLNALLLGLRRGVVAEPAARDFLARLEGLPIGTDAAAPRREAVLDLSLRHGLSAYDGTYLDLALRRDAVLATFDRRLAGAAEAAGVRRFSSRDG